MSVSKLESLPNEILVDLFEKYIDGIDIINAFAFQLNRRFDALIMESRRLRFNFIRCRKDDFRVCMGLLPAYVDKIQELTLTERYTPGQIHAFLSFYPSFPIFKNLRKLYLQVDTNTVDPVVFTGAIASLANMALHTLSINVSPVEESYPLEDTIRDIFYIKTLKKLSITGSLLQRLWNLLKEDSSKIEYLKVHGAGCACIDLQYIFRCTTSLRYVDIDVGFYGSNEYPKLSRSSLDPLLAMSKLHTAIFNINLSIWNRKMIDYFKILFEYMPQLHHLQIKIGCLELPMDICERLMQTAPLSLTSFILDVNLPRITDKYASNILTLTETPFWFGKEHFHFIIKDVLQSVGRRFNLKASNVLGTERQNEIIFRWDTNLDCMMSDRPCVLNRISKLYLFPHSHSLSQHYYLNNVTHLFIDGLDDHLFNYITTHINCSRIQHLDMSSMEGNILTFPMLEAAANMRSLRINLRQLHDDLSLHSRTHENVQSLDLSVDLHTFNKKDICTISKRFPHLQHLIIYTKDLCNVPILETYLPSLRSFTFCSTDLSDILQYDAHEHEQLHDFLRSKANFFFQQNDDWITIWIDQAALRDSYWHKTVKTDHSKNFLKDSLIGKAINKISSLFQ